MKLFQSVGYKSIKIEVDGTQNNEYLKRRLKDCRMISQLENRLPGFGINRMNRIENRLFLADRWIGYIQISW